ncbi:MAG: restriction endonuclease subunit S [Candidatus Nomurabacteria bacterium]|jgi:hypothetical protein|nr:restriction endonuclease subunit S [Candidatus Nomurabacteria bacterium]
MKNNLDTTNWQYFNLRDLFKVERGERLVKPDRIAGNIPLATAGFEKQGIADFISNIEMERYKNAVTIDMFGNAFYRGYEFCCDDNILVLTSDSINKQTGLFVIAILNRDNYRNAYGRQYRQKTFAQHKIKLPAKNGKPDWNYMEKFVDTHTHNYNYATKPAQDLPTPALKTSGWKFYELGEFFNVKYGNGFELVNLVEGQNGVNYVARTEKNNGVAAFVDEPLDIEPFEANGITVAVGGSVLSTFLQPKPFYSGFHILILEPKEEINNFAKLFLTTLIRKEKYRYNYGRQANRTLKNLRIKLPIKNNKPDWDFMTNFIQTLPFSSQIC